MSSPLNDGPVFTPKTILGFDANNAVDAGGVGGHRGLDGPWEGQSLPIADGPGYLERLLRSE